jgi:hypothetical protein
VNEHSVTNNKWSTFVTTVNTSCKCPCSFKVLNVTFIDLCQLRKCLVSMVTTRVSPVISICNCFFLVSSS